jgi:hypothetical protein
VAGIERQFMKITVDIHVSADEDPADDVVVQNLKDVGFEEQSDADGSTRLIYNGDIARNDLAYGASMMKSLKSR